MKWEGGPFWFALISIHQERAKAGPRHLAPNLLSRPVDHLLELLKVICMKAPEEVPGCGGIGNPAGSEQVLDGVAMLEIGNVFDAMSSERRQASFAALSQAICSTRSRTIVTVIS